MYRQIEEHNKAKDNDAKEKRLEQDARIEAENNFRSEQQLAKDRRIREQKAYRDFLFGQMNERKARENHREWQEKMYLENRMMATNDRNDAIRKQVTAIGMYSRAVGTGGAGVAIHGTPCFFQMWYMTTI